MRDPRIWMGHMNSVDYRYNPNFDRYYRWLRLKYPKIGRLRPRRERFVALQKKAEERFPRAFRFESLIGYAYRLYSANRLQLL